jgi:hypothetical protein
VLWGDRVGALSEEDPVTTIRVGKRQRFTSVDRKAINDASLSFRTRGILVWLLDKPDDWQTTADRIETQGTEGREAIAASLKELERAGYLVRDRKRDPESGKWVVDWTVYERPPTANRRRLTVDGYPDTGTRTLITEDGELKTDLGKLREKADPGCPQCQGIGSFYRAGAGTDAPCDCTRREDLHKSADAEV